MNVAPVVLLTRRPIEPLHAVPAIERRLEDAEAMALWRSCFFRGWIFARSLIPHLPDDAAAMVREAVQRGDDPTATCKRLELDGYHLPGSRDAVDVLRKAMGLRPVPRPSTSGPLLTSHPPIDGVDC